MIPSVEECYKLMDKYGMLDNIKAHSAIVEKVAAIIAKGLIEAGSDLSLEKVTAGALMHDIGKTLVGTFLEANGFRVIDLGRDVPVDRFVEKALEVSADIICLSALLTTTMTGQARLVKRLDERGLRDRFAVLVGGAPVTPEYARNIGADGYGANAVGALSEALKKILP